MTAARVLVRAAITIALVCCATVVAVLGLAEREAARRLELVPAWQGTHFPRNIEIAFEAQVDDGVPRHDELMRLVERVWLAVHLIDEGRHPRSRLHFCRQSFALAHASPWTRVGQELGDVERLLVWISLADQLEARWSRDELRAAYLENVWFGPGVAGVREAARKRFGREVDDLSLGESFVLARASWRYGDTANPQSGRDWSIADAARRGLITEEQRDRALAEPMPRFLPH